MSSSNESDASSYNSDHFTSTSNDEEILEDMDNEDMAIFHCMVVPCNSHEFFTSHEIEEGVGCNGWCLKRVEYNASHQICSRI
jgi:hypothetical protein